MKRRVLRKRITLSEVLFGVAFCLLLAVSTIWVVAQKHNFDPADRDISFETLEKDSNEGELYVTPLKRWSEPGSAPTAQAGVDLGLFPRGLLDGGWELDGRVETYDADTLYEKINGAADLYIAFGFRRLHYVTLAQDSRFLNVELYDQGNFRNVIGLFSAQKDANREVLRRGEIFYYPTSVGVIGGYRNFYFKIAGSSTDDATLDKAASLIELIEDLPAGAGELPRPFRVLTEGLGIPSERLEYQLKDVFQYDFLTDFWFSRVADQGETRYFIHESDDAGTASALYAKLAEEQKVEYSVIEEEGDSLLLQHRFLNTFFAMRLDGGAILGIDGAPSAETARNLLDDLQKAFDGR
jgi:hypothetical protein